MLYLRTIGKLRVGRFGSRRPKLEPRSHLSVCEACPASCVSQSAPAGRYALGGLDALTPKEKEEEAMRWAALMPCLWAVTPCHHGFATLLASGKD